MKVGESTDRQASKKMPNMKFLELKLNPILSLVGKSDFISSFETMTAKMFKTKRANTATIIEYKFEINKIPIRAKTITNPSIGDAVRIVTLLLFLFTLQDNIKPGRSVDKTNANNPNHTILPEVVGKST